MEMEQLQGVLTPPERTDIAIQLCGFGPIAAAARASNLISRYQPDRVLLIGIAGTFDAQRYPVGSAHRFTKTRCDGIGIGTGDSFIGASQLGWPQFKDAAAQPEIGDTLINHCAVITISWATTGMFRHEVNENTTHKQHQTYSGIQLYLCT